MFEPVSKKDDPILFWIAAFTLSAPATIVLGAILGVLLGLNANLITYALGYGAAFIASMFWLGTRKVLYFVYFF